MFKHSFQRATAFSAVFSMILLASLNMAAQQKAQHKPSPQKDIIITDDVMMLSTPATGAERMACCPYPSGRSVSIAAGQNASIAWKEGKIAAGDTLRLVRLEIRKNGTAIAQLTLTLKPKTKPAAMQCMKGFGCENRWEAYPWKSSAGNFLEHPAHKFRLTPKGTSHFIIQNLDDKTPLTVVVNPCDNKQIKAKTSASKRN